VRQVHTQYSEVAAAVGADLHVALDTDRTLAVLIQRFDSLASGQYSMDNIGLAALSDAANRIIRDVMTLQQSGAANGGAVTHGSTVDQPSFGVSTAVAAAQLDPLNRRTLASLRDQLVAAQLQQRTLEDRLQSALQAEQQHQQREQGYTHDVAQLRQHIADLNARLSEKDSELHSAQQRATEQTLMLAQTQRDMELSRVELVELREGAVKSEAAVTGLRQQLQNTERRLADRDQHVSSLHAAALSGVHRVETLLELMNRSGRAPAAKALASNRARVFSVGAYGAAARDEDLTDSEFETASPKLAAASSTAATVDLPPAHVSARTSLAAPSRTVARDTVKASDVPHSQDDDEADGDTVGVLQELDQKVTLLENSIGPFVARYRGKSNRVKQRLADRYQATLSDAILAVEQQHRSQLQLERERHAGELDRLRKDVYV